MGAWGTGTLENDDALDLLRDAVHADDGPELVAEALGSAIGAAADGYVEGPDAAAALAAAELVAAARGLPGAALTPDAGAWAARAPSLAALAPRARSACQAVLTASEVAEVWAERGAERAWRARVEDLLHRLR